MRKTDYIVVGMGIAGLSVCEQLHRRGLKYVVIDSGERSATKIAGGVVNPVVLKRFTAVWNAEAFMDEAKVFYQDLSRRMDCDFLRDLPLFRLFASVEEQNNWSVAGESPLLKTLLSSDIIKNKNQYVRAALGLGPVLQSFRIDTELLLKEYNHFLKLEEHYIEEVFHHSDLTLFDTKIRYRNIEAKRIIFAEGSAVLHNPFFTTDWLVPKKGEYIIFKAPQLQLKSILKGPFFIIPLGNDLYQAGATFAHDDTSNRPTEKGRTQLEKAVAKMIHCDFEIMDQLAGMRPTIKDRRPILGSLQHKQVLFYNGLGTRGLLMAPLLSKWLVSFAEDGTQLPAEVDIKRVLPKGS
jgi:glycine/D-amino acid oxidase-like deaminating enzyme